MEKQTFVSLIPAGGKSTRLMPLTDDRHPKWGLSIGGSSLMRQTMRRGEQVKNFSKTLILASESQMDIMNKLLKKKTYSAYSVIWEPSQKNTYASFALGNISAYLKFGDCATGFFPADHYIENTDAFLKDVAKAISQFDNSITVIGIKPASPDTGFGYIHSKGSKVLKFTEKPDEATAKKYLKSGGYFWNAGIFITRAKFIYDLLQEFDPVTCQLLEGYIKESGKDKKIALWEKLERISVDYKLIEPLALQGKVNLVQAHFDWSDAGTFEALQETPIFAFN